MEQNIQTIIDLVTANENISAEEKTMLISKLKEADKKITIAEFKLDRTEKVKRTTAILLEETIEELENKRKAVEAQNRELEIEAALERVRTVAMSMNKTDDVLSICKVMFTELKSLGFDELRNALINFFDDEHNALQDYDYADFSGGHIAHIPYNSHPTFENFQKRIRSATDAFAELVVGEDELESWKERRRQSGEYEDPRLENITALYYYFYSIGVGAVGISTFSSLNEEKLKIIKRFRNVFDLAYRRYIDIQKAEAQARESRIQLALERLRARTMAMHNSSELSEAATLLFDQLSQLGVELWSCGFTVCKENSDIVERWMSLPNGEMLEPLRVPLSSGYGESILYNVWKDKVELFTYIAEGEELDKGFENLKSHSSTQIIYQRIVEIGIPFPTWMQHFVASFRQGYLWIMAKKPFEETEIFKRFAKVFEQTYTRFLDLQKAEAQAREAQIEAALERIRSRAMAMHKSEELLEAGEILFLEMQKLGIESLTAGYVLMDKEGRNGLNYTPHPGTKKIMRVPVIIPHNETIHMQKVVENWKKGNPSFVVEMDEDETIKHQTFIAERSTNFPLTAAQLIDISPAKLFLHNFYFKEGYILIVGGTKLSAEQTDIMLRFTKVFQQTYTRFLDLQKAEAQAREAQIQLALERVRARTMAMQHSEELSETSYVLFQQLKELGEDSDQTSIGIFEDDHSVITVYSTTHGSQWAYAARIPLTKHSVYQQMYSGWKNNLKSLVIDIAGEELEALNKFKLENPDYQVSADDLPRERWIIYNAFFSKGTMAICTTTPRTAESIHLFERFAQVFDHTYRRFLDLQNAEAQAREARLETALERVRSRSIGMQKSEELKEVIKIVYEQIVQLNIKIDHAGFVVDYMPKGDWTFWIADKLEIPSKISHQYFDSVWANQFNEAKEKGIDFFATHLNFEEKNKFYNDLFAHVPGVPEASKEFYLSSPGVDISNVLLEDVALYIENFEGIPYTDEENKILLRFGKVFQQTYTRFLDLQKAEAQAREALVEAALERIRSRAMAMRTSDELNLLIGFVFAECTKLNMQLDRGFIMTFDKNTNDSHWWMVGADAPDMPMSILVKYHEYAPSLAILKGWKEREQKWSYVLEGDNKRTWTDYCFTETGLGQLPDFVKDNMRSVDSVILNASFQNFGCIMLSSFEPLTEEHFDLLIRLSKVFDLTYTRFLDLQKAEAQAREAQVETALERVRSRTLAMQRSDELAETSAVLFKQLIGLGISPNRLYISIIKDDEGESEFWITDEDGSKVSMAYETNLTKQPSFKKMFEGWKNQKKSLIIDMHGKELEAYFQYLTSIHVPFKGGLEQKRRVQHIAYFSKGFIGMASPEEQPAATLQLLERFAYVFNLTFTRFNDLQVAEAHALQAEQDLIAIKEAKQKAEEAFTELQAAQKQLIQSEKMASLGELTAGIAHEIQNPLNFVNNFSEVSNELIDEMNEELRKGDIEEAKAIASDIQQNLLKINHHGQRAEAIVKGMLQHSRTSSGQKELTDINVLADEYLRLAYHGLRAKDKSFNATLKTNYDETIGAVNIIPQDIGRVILNLITNAFYTVTEKKKSSAGNYEPTVSVTTKHIHSPLGVRGIEINVTDNGNGIPQKIVDKIFQPFFTTKPTGQGTGLGLSLVYDIIKAHDGEIKVETKEGEGTEFIIVLPA